ncbi:type II secretion system pseudopilin TklG [Syntrophotalea carbinolica DSM 2380]|uniref:Type II secretion system pseudopilin TklG n=1 Tax=Syntrophotalea carbinolica (strain DSM 2380 / NBRC 103641 / GraBd1) TaxID=338963 RepID=Q3A8A2_SYNC1|nr:type II secretion system protein [Syntrophotalea carbinolica]ABA87390.1 type II secretion system pseudopilin TklG [Syntrophotalea carbinolica DSM 2380]
MCRIFQNQRGVALMAVLIMVVIMGLGAGIVGTTWKTKVQRSKEQELLWRGNQYRKAIASYYRVTRATYPPNLEVLERDPRFLQRVRHIRRFFKDPITGTDFVLIRDASGTITGVRSSSNLEPFKKDGFPHEYAHFANCKRYSEWEFVYKPENRNTAVPSTTETPLQESLP